MQISRMGDQPTEETQFVVDEVSNVIKEAIETTIGGNSYMVCPHVYFLIFCSSASAPSCYSATLFPSLLASTPR